MANFLYNAAATRIMEETLLLLTHTLKIMLVKSAYVPDRDHEFISSVGANEIVATNYTGGFGGAGRHTLAGKTVTKDNVNDRGELDCNDAVWTALGGAANDTIGHALIIREITNDAASWLIGHIDTATGSPVFPFTTNGGDFTLQINVEGLIQLLTT